jgi:probable F420-dependent oxidoreductase
MDYRSTYTRRADLPLTLGLDMPFTEGDMHGQTPRWADLREMAQAAEEVGFDVVWFSDHMGFADDKGSWEGWRGSWEALTVTAALAASTSRVQLGNFVLAVPFRNPGLLAKMAETIDEISGGRFILGIGAGWNEPEFRAWDFPYDDRFDRFEDSLRIICSMLRTGRADHEGKVVSARGALTKPRGPRPEGLPVMVGAGGPRMLRLTAELADAWDGGMTPVDEAHEILGKVDAACRAAGRDPRTLQRSLEALVCTIPEAADEPPEKNELRGTPEELAAELLRYAPLGIDHLVITTNPQTVDGVRAFRPVIAAMAPEGARRR